MIKIKVPATSANMGPGFDCLGIALNLYNYFYIEEVDRGLEIEGCNEQFKNEDNLVFSSMRKCFEIIGYKPKGIKIKMQCEIPISRGLGSSAACILAGVIGANEIAGGVLSRKQILEIASKIEGHSDNIAPALLGGMTIAIKDGEQVFCERINISKEIKLCALIPNFTLSTSESRAVLPKEIPYKDAVFNVGRTALMIASLVNGNFSLISMGCEDKLHQFYRASLIENYDEIIRKCKELNCLGTFLSGAGPTIMVMLEKENTEFSDNIENYVKGFKNKWVVKELIPNYEGVEIGICDCKH